MLHRKPRLAPEYIFPVDEWNVVEKRFSPEYLGQTETLFALSNGYVGIRGTFEEGRPVFSSGTFVNGFHETFPIVYGESACRRHPPAAFRRRRTLRAELCASAAL